MPRAREDSTDSDAYYSPIYELKIYTFLSNQQGADLVVGVRPKFISRFVHRTL